MKRSEFLKKVGQTGLGVGIITLANPQITRGGVKSNSRFNKLIGNKSIGNNGDGTVTGIIGNQALQTTSKSMSGAVNEILSTAETSIKNSFNGCSLAYQNEHFTVSYIKDNVTVETKTIGVCKINLNTNAGNQSSVSEISCQVKSRNGNAYAIELENPADNALLAPARTGYTFAGWYDGNGRELSVDSLMNGKTFFAQWSAVSYTLSFNANGGNVSTASKSVPCGSAYGTLPVPTRTEYTFLGWYTATSGGTKVTESTIMGANNVTLYALWKDAVAPTITKSFTSSLTNMGVIGNFNPSTGQFDEYWQTCDVTVNFTATDNIGIVAYYLGKTNPQTTSVSWTAITQTKTFSTQQRIGLNGNNPLYTADPSGTWYFAVKDVDGNIAVSTIEAVFKWMRGASSFSTSWITLPNPGGYTNFAISYNHSSNCMYATYNGVTKSAENAGCIDFTVNGGNANVRWRSIPNVQTSYYYVYFK